MQRSLGLPGLRAFLLVASTSTAALTRAPTRGPELVHEVDADVVGEVDVTARAANVAGDTIWIADWSFDAAGGGCDDSGWQKIDLRIVSDGSNYWSIDTSHGGQGYISGNAAELDKHDLC